MKRFLLLIWKVFHKTNNNESTDWSRVNSSNKCEINKNSSKQSASRWQRQFMYIACGAWFLNRRWRPLFIIWTYKNTYHSVLAALVDSSAKRTISADLLILSFVSRQKKESSEAIRLSHVSCDLYVAFFEQFSNCFIIGSSNSLDRNSMNFW